MRNYLARRGAACVIIKNLAASWAENLGDLLTPYVSLTPVTWNSGPSLWSIEVSPYTSLPCSSHIVAEGYKAAVSDRPQHLHVATGLDEARSVQSILRVLRAVLRRIFMSDTSAFCLHGASVAVSRSSDSIAIVGSKRSGKTSAVLTALKSGRFDYVTNDDLIVTNGGSGYVGHGWPRSVNIRKYTAEMLIPPGIVETLAHPENSMNEQIGRWGLAYPSELAKLFSCRVVAQAEIRAFVFPEFGTTNNIAPLPPAEAAERIKTEVQPSPSEADKWMDQMFPALLGRHATVDLARLCLAVPCYSMTSRDLAGLEANVVTIGKTAGLL